MIWKISCVSRYFKGKVIYTAFGQWSTDDFLLSQGRFQGPEDLTPLLPLLRFPLLHLHPKLFVSTTCGATAVASALGVSWLAIPNGLMWPDSLPKEIQQLHLRFQDLRRVA